MMISAKLDDLYNEYDDLNAKHLKFRNVMLAWHDDSSGLKDLCLKMGKECDVHPLCSLNDEKQCKPRDEYNKDKHEEKWGKDLLLNAPICDVPLEACHLLTAPLRKRNDDLDLCSIIDGKCQLNPRIVR